MIELDATSKTTWHYYSLKDGKVIGTGEETEADNKAWASRKDWDIAIMRFYVKTNSGTSGQGKGGVYTCKEDVTFDGLTSASMPESEFVADELVTEDTMSGGQKTTSKSKAVVSVMKGMPPTWLKSPIYVFRSADGNDKFKIEFLSYKNEEGESGHVSFNLAAL